MIPRPFVKWAGGKTYLLPELHRIVDATITRHPGLGYCEPMVGGGALYWTILDRFSKLVVADVNPDLINLYTIIRDDPDALISELMRPDYKFIHKSDKASLATYYRIRASEPTDSVERAARLLFLLRTCFNGLMRTNQKGRFNVPAGSYKNPKICNPELILTDSAALQGTDIICDMAIATIKSLTTPHLIFLDPPYHGEKKFTQYSGGFDLDRQKELAKTIIESPHPFIYTNRSHPDINCLFDGIAGITIKKLPLRHTVQPQYTTGLVEEELLVYRG